ncbi:hypothetical protein B7494_g5445 [Chlorociboria aeruginascens]|nr:hypothetical protein B7494_g5445 [Chlorociboria aeruginascens]
MHGTVEFGDEQHLDPPPRLFDRLRQIAGYTWDESKAPFHSSYDNWHVFGTKNTSPAGQGATIQPVRPGSERNSPRDSPLVEGSSEFGVPEGSERTPIEVVARISTHALREERAYSLCKSVIRNVDPDGSHIARPIDLVRLTTQQGDKSPIVVCIYESPGPNYLAKVIDFGPAFYTARKVNDEYKVYRDESFVPKQAVALMTFLDFAIGVIECIEILHHGQRIVHGEIRGDAFHMNETTGRVKLVNFGSGLRTFEKGLTSTGWSMLSQELGAKTKLSFMSSEQTGRLPAEPDSRTDIYSLGILFWTMLAQQPAFDGETPMDIIQGVLGRRYPLETTLFLSCQYHERKEISISFPGPSISSIRLDIPDIVGKIIQKMTAKTIGERYHSASGLRYDFIEVRRLLSAGDSTALNNFHVATNDVSSFFILPTTMIGRNAEHDAIVEIIDKVSKRHVIGQRQDVCSISSGSTSSEGRLGCLNLEMAAGDFSSEGDRTSSVEDRFNSIDTTGNLSADHRTPPIHSGSVGTSFSSHNTSSDSQASSIRTNPNVKPWGKNVSLDSRNAADSASGEGSGLKSTSDGAGSVNQRNAHKFRRRGCCEVISIAGAAGLGKSCLVQSVQVEARQRGYFASSKFDQAKKTPFGPVLNLLSSLFKQVFSESNTETTFHQVLKQYVRPAWPLFHHLLGLPEFLLGPLAQSHTANRSNELPQGYNKSLRDDFKRPDSSPSSQASKYSMALGVQSSQDFLHAGSSTRSTRLINTFLDVLRVFTEHKFICFCLDDLQFADDESLDLITQMIVSRMKMVFILTHRPDEMLPEKIKAILETPTIEGHVKARGVGITHILLQPLTEQNVIDYVAATLRRPEQEIIPLAAVIQTKTAGNPFYMRELLDSCHRKHFIWYDFKQNAWLYDLDCILKQFESKNYNDTLNIEFITSRLDELPPAARSIIAWASLIGSYFSFELIQRLLSGEFDDDFKQEAHGSFSLSHSQQDAVGGLQAAIQLYIIVATGQDDRFRFSHDKYIQAAASLKGFDAPKMHFIIAQTLLKYYSTDEESRGITASHICESIDIIKARVLHRQSYRKILFDCAQTAAESGARPTAARFFSHCFALLQDNPWNDGATDVYYEESLNLYLRAAECFLYMGQYREANQLLDEIFSNAKTPVDKAPAWVLQSRIFAQEDNSSAAFLALKQCLAALDIEVDDHPSLQKCDAEFERLSLKIQSIDQDHLINKSMTKDSNLAAVGAVLAETISAAFWSDSLIFYQMSLVIINTSLTYGSFPQAGMGYIHLAMIAITRFNMVKFASEIGNLSVKMMDRWHDPYTLGRGGALYALFVGHIQNDLPALVGQLEGALEYAIQAGDRISTILNFGLVSTLKFFASEHLAELEPFCTYGCEEVPNWQFDTRGGTMIIAVRQVCRALQGKTTTTAALEIMSDENHNALLYKAWLQNNPKNSDRPLLFYESLEIIPLFLFGHYQRAIVIGDASLKKIDDIWSARNSRFLMLFQGLALAGLLWGKIQDRLRSVRKESLSARTDQPSEAELDDEIARVSKSLKYFQRKIEDWQMVTDVNYLAWSKFLAAQVAEIQNDHGSALRSYEEALDHASAHNFIFEEALGNYLLAGFLLRAGSRRPAKASLRESVMLYRQFGAVGVAKHIEDEHSLLLQGPTRNLRTAEIGVQTDFAGDSAPVQYETLEGDENDERQHSRALITETKGDRIGAWQGASARDKAGSGLPALDMLDLTSILESSQVISSVLQVDQLLKTMCEIILQNCGGLASTAAIIVEETDPIGWSIAASGDPETTQAHIPGIPLSETAIVAEGVILYCTRFRETVFLPDLMHDERFSNVSEAWSARNPVGKSVIAIPICHGVKPLLGVLYLEGEANAFTDRNLTVLQLLVNQIGISYSNALTLKEVERVSAFNNSMIDLQKRALKTALEAEISANANLKLAEENARAKQTFLANVSHELRTPLNGVIGNSELLRDSGLRKDQAEMADSIRVSADLLLTVINDILDFSKMEADKMKLFVVAFNADEMIREVVRSVSYSERKKSSKNVEIIQDIHLPQYLIFGDPVRLHQVLGNLIGNSLKFTENGSITVGAKTDWETKDSVKLTFWVKDTGIGIGEKELKNLFKPFSQADASTARKYGGSGLGLSICKSLVESMMGGIIELESVENVGTTAWFSVTFKKADPDSSAGDSQIEPLKENETAKNAKPDSILSTMAHPDLSSLPRGDLRVCIAEDNRINAKIAIQFLEKLGFKHVDAYDNGLEAVQGLRKKANEGTPYHIVLMDVQMPVLDGYEATKLLRKDPIEAVRHVVVISMTASAIAGDREKCLESGMNDYLAKPVRSAVLKQKLDQYLQQIPLDVSDLRVEANKIAKAVLKEANGSASSPSNSRTATPRSVTPEIMLGGNSAQLNVPSQSSGHNRTTRSKNATNYNEGESKQHHDNKSVSLKVDDTTVDNNEEVADGINRLIGLRSSGIY